MIELFTISVSCTSLKIEDVKSELNDWEEYYKKKLKDYKTKVICIRDIDSIHREDKHQLIVVRVDCYLEKTKDIKSELQNWEKYYTEKLNDSESNVVCIRNTDTLILGKI